MNKYEWYDCFGYINLCILLPVIVEGMPAVDSSDVSVVVKEIGANGAVGSDRHLK